MNRTALFVAVALAVASLAGGHALAQPAARAATADAAALAPAHDAPRAGRHAARAARLAHAVRHDPGLAVIVNLRAIERLYRHEGKAKDLPGFYREQLAKTQDPLVRNFVQYRIARLELRDGDAAAALEALRRNLEENYRRL